MTNFLQPLPYDPPGYPCPTCNDTRDDCPTCGSAPDEAAYAADWRGRVDDGTLETFHPLQPGFWEPIACHVRGATVGFEALMERPHD